MLRLTVSAALIIANSATLKKQAVSLQKQPIPTIVHPDQNQKVQEAFTKATNVSQLESLTFNQPLYEPGNPIDWRLWTAIYVNNQPLAQDMIKTYPDRMLHNKNITEMVNAVGISCQCEEGCDPCFESTLSLSIVRRMDNVTNALLKKPYTRVNIQSPKYHKTWTVLETPLLTAIKTQNENALRSLLRHPKIDVSLVGVAWRNYRKRAGSTAMKQVKYLSKMISIIQEEMCDFIARAHKDEEAKRKQFLKYIPNEKACDYIQNNIAYDADNKGKSNDNKGNYKSNDDKDKSKIKKTTKTSSRKMIVVGIIAMALGAIALCYFFLKPLLMKKPANQENDENIV